MLNVTEQLSASIHWPCGDLVICGIFEMSPFAIEMASMAFGSDFLPSHTYQVHKIKVVQFGLHGWILCCQVLDEMTKASELFLGLSAGNFLKKLPECLFTL